MNAQLTINSERLSTLIGKTYQAIIDKYDPELNCYLARYFGQALDDVDGYIYLFDNLWLFFMFHKLLLN